MSRPNSHRVLVLFAGIIVLMTGLLSVRVGAETTNTGTLTLRKVTDPAGGQQFPLTAVGFQRVIRTNMRSPRDIDRDADGRLYVIGRRTSRIIIYSPTGAPLLEFGSKGTGPSQLLFPESLALSTTIAGRMYVTDTENNRIQMFSTSGDHIGSWGSFGTAPGSFSSPMGIAIDDLGNVYVTDTFNHRVQKFDSEGEFLLEWGSQGSGNGQFLYPAGIDVAANGDIYITDSNNHRIQVFSSDGQYLGGWGSLGTGNGQFNLPADLHVDDSGMVYVSDTYNQRVQKFTADGHFLAVWGAAGTGNGQFQRPNGITIDSEGQVYVVDIDNQRVEIFSQATVFLDDGEQESMTLPAGDYVVSEPLRSGWALGSVDCESPSRMAHQGGVSVSLAAGATVSCTFNNRTETTTGDLTARLYNDFDRDGQLGSGEAALVGWTVRLRDASNEQVGDDQTTDAAGLATFSDIPAGDYAVCQILPVGWRNSEPGGPNGAVPGTGLEVCRLVKLSSAGAEVRLGNYEQNPTPPTTYLSYVPLIRR